MAETKDKKQQLGPGETFFIQKLQPSCRRCGKTAYSSESTKYDGATYHNACFKCWTCQTSLTLHGIAQMNSEVYCKDCFTKTFKESGGTYKVFKERGADDLPSFPGGPKKLQIRTEGGRKNWGRRPKNYDENKDCWQCYKPLGKTVMHSIEHKWHPECYYCYQCSKVFGPEDMVNVVGDWPFCNQECADGRTCNNCKKVIETDVADALGKKWHEECFACDKCKKHLGGDTFVVRTDKPTVPLCELCAAGFTAK